MKWFGRSFAPRLSATLALATATASGPTACCQDLPLAPGCLLRFASVEEGVKAVTVRDDFIRDMSPFDRQVLVRTDRPVSEAELLSFFAQHVLPWAPADIERLKPLVADVSKKLATWKLALPGVVLLVKTDGQECAGAAYCRGAVVGAAQSLVGVGQFIAQRDLGLRWLGEMVLNPAASGASVLEGPARILRAYGLMRHPNALGAILPLSLLAAVSLWARSAGRWRLVWLALIVLDTAGLVVSFSRAGWLGALAGLLVLIDASRRPGRLLPRGLMVAWTPIALVLLLVVAGAVSWQPALFLGRLLGALGTGLEHGGLAERIFGLQNAWTVIQRWPLWGVGTRQYVLVVANLLDVTPRESLLVESTPLLLWAELGLAAPMAWLGLGLALVWLGGRRSARQLANPDLALATAWVAAVEVVCLFQAFYWPSHELWQGSLWLGIVLGLWARSFVQPAGAAALGPG